MSNKPCLVSGAAGAVVLNLLHQSAKALTSLAPEMDVLGERALKKGLRSVGVTAPENLKPWTFAGDLAANSIYYALVGLGESKTAVRRGAVLGALAGLGALTLPGPMGLGTKPATKTAVTASMAFAWYFLGGVAAGLVASQLQSDSRTSH